MQKAMMKVAVLFFPTFEVMDMNFMLIDASIIGSILSLKLFSWIFSQVTFTASCGSSYECTGVTLRPLAPLFLPSIMYCFCFLGISY